MRKEMPPTKSIEDLPREMLAEILSYVSIEDLIYSMQDVCTQWKAASQDTRVWRHRDYSPEYNKSDTEIASILEQSPKLQTLIISQRIDSDLRTAIAQHCPNLKKLMFNDYQELSVPFLKLLVKKCPNIVSFAVPFPISCSLRKLEIIGRFSHLKDLCFAGWADEDHPVMLKPIADGCPSLQSIDLIRQMHTHDQLVYFLRKKKDQLHTLGVRWCSVDLKNYSTPPISVCTVLKSLHMNCYWDINIEKGFPTLRSLSSVTCLTLSRLCYANIDDVVRVFEKHGMKQLVELRITQYVNYEDKLANVIVKNCPRLKLLFLELCMEVHDESVENFHFLLELESISLRGCDLANCELSLSKCIHLKYLNLADCRNLRESSLELITEYSNLEVLILDECNIKSLPMHLFSIHLTHLAQLSINFCINVDEIALVQLKAERPRLVIHDQNIEGCFHK